MRLGSNSRGEAVPGPLCREPKERRDDDALAHSRRRDQLFPAVFRRLLLHLESLLDLREPSRPTDEALREGKERRHSLKLDELRVHISLRVVLGQDRVRLLAAATGDEPSRRLGNEPHEEELQYAGRDLEDGRDSPSPIVRH